MTWFAIVALTAGTAGLRLTGMFAIGPLLDRWPVLRRVAEVLPAAVVAAVVVQLTFVSKGDLSLDTRAVGIVVAGVLVWRRAPLWVVVVGAAVATAAVRAFV